MASDAELAAELKAGWIALSERLEDRHGGLPTLATATETAGGQVLQAVDFEGLRHLLVPLPPGTTQAPTDTESRVWVSLTELQGGGAICTYVDVVCRVDHLRELFDDLL